VRTHPNNWISVFGGSAWEWHEGRQQFYLHNFLKEQPDLNFYNPEVQREILDIVRFWLDLGVDGLRLDVVNFYFHDQELRDNPPRPAALGAATQFEGDDPYSQQAHIYDKSRPENLEFIRRLRLLVDEYPNRFMVGEIGDDDPITRSVEYTQPGLLHTTYNTQMMSGARKTLTPKLIQKPIQQFETAGPQCWPSWAFSNHDVVRAVSRWQSSGDGFGANPKLAQFLIVLLSCLRGTVFIYQGEELGLPEAQLNFEDLQDPWGKHLWPAWQGRDGCRTPLPWSGAVNAGFSQHTPWLPIAKTHIGLDITSQDSNTYSVLNFTRAFLKWRKSQPALISGSIEFLDPNTEQELYFVRSTAEQTIHCHFNFLEFEFSLK
jgi:alpha-glucosidase